MNLFEYLSKGVTPHQTVAASAEFLKDNGFTELKLSEPFTLKKGGKYFIKTFSTTLISFTVGKKVTPAAGLHIAAAHTDHPCLHIKPKAEMTSNSYMKVDTEVYGGPILNTWLDRPLSIAGIVALKSKDPYQPDIRYIDFKKPVAYIPNLAIHMNREVNKGVELKKQNDMLPVLGLLNESMNKDSFLLDAIAKELDTDKKNIADFDLYVYCLDKPNYVGLNEEMLSSPRLDNLTSCYALLQGIKDGVRKDGVNVAVLFDHEEIGSHTKQGADSAVLKLVLEKIYTALGLSTADLNDAILKGFLFSVDVAHATHPAHAEKYDAINNAKFNEGLTIKVNSNQRYTFDTSAVATCVALCEKAGAKCQKFANHSDMVGGGTLGPIISSWLPMQTVDIGVPILAMHSACELMGREDQDHLNKLMTEFFK